MRDLSIHLIPFLEMAAAVVAVPVMAFYAWRGVRRRRRARLTERLADASRRLP
jgi:hypothetical protein